METAMQQFIRVMEETISDNRTDIIIALTIKAHINLATELLAKEKEQIIDAYNNGYRKGGIKAKFTGNDYYTKTYNTRNE